jgi:L-iditol 2-dehydrogenase
MARTGGKVALIGMGTPNPLIPLGAAALREVDLIGVFRYASTWPDALRLLASDAMKNVEKVMVTQRYALEDTAKAFELIASGGIQADVKEIVLKIMVGPNYVTPAPPVPVTLPVPIPAPVPVIDVTVSE